MPTLNAGNDTAICAGSTINLSASGTSSFFQEFYTWSPDSNLIHQYQPNPIVSPTTTTTYTVVFNNGFGECALTDHITVTMISLDTPIINLDGYVLSVTNPQPTVTYTWQQLNGSSWEDIVPLATGTSYTITSTNKYKVNATNICGDRSYSDPLLATKVNQIGFYLYPNPATNMIWLDGLQRIDGWQTAEVINTLGQKLLPIKDIRDQANIAVDIAILSSGVYFLKLTKANDETIVFKFVKK